MASYIALINWTEEGINSLGRSRHVRVAREVADGLGVGDVPLKQG